MKKVCSLILSVVLTIVCLTGCANDKAFSETEIIAVAKKYGMKEAEDYSDVKSVYDNDNTAYYYFSNDEDEIRKGDYMFQYYTVTGYLYGALNEEFGNEYVNDYSCIELIIFENNDDAEEYYKKRIDEYFRSFSSSTWTIESGDRDGYFYCIKGGRNDDDMIGKMGCYLCGNRVLFISASGLDDGKTGFANYIFKKLGLAEPKIKD